MRCQISSVKGVKNSKIVSVTGKSVERKKKYKLLKTQRCLKKIAKVTLPFLSIYKASLRHLRYSKIAEYQNTDVSRREVLGTDFQNWNHLMYCKM